MQKKLEFSSKSKWIDYAVNYMRSIDVNRLETAGLEVHLVARGGVIGKWIEDSNSGYIIESRAEERLKMVGGS